MAVIWVVATSLSDLAGELGPASDPAQPGRAVDVDPNREVEVAASEVEWSVGPGTLGGFSVRSTVAGADGFIYALSTAPGLREMPVGEPPPMAVYRSAGGLDWSSEPLDGLGEDLWAKEVAYSGSHLYVLGTAPAAADPLSVGLRIGSSADGGSTWEAQDLPLAAAAPPGNLGGSSTLVHVAGGPEGVVAGAGTAFYVDYAALVPPEVMTPSSFVQRTADGLVVFDYSQMTALETACSNGNQTACNQLSNAVWEPTLRWSGTWEELGGEPPPDSFVDLFHAAPGGNFTSVDTPFGTGYTLAEIGVGGEGAFYAAVYPGGGGFDSRPLIELWRSDDGRTWAQVEGVPPIDQMRALGAVGGRTALVGTHESRVVVASVGEGSDWDVYDLVGLVPVPNREGQWVSAVAMGSAGLIMNVSTWTGVEGGMQREVTQLLETADLLTWSSTPTATIVNGYVDQVMVGEELLIINASPGAAEGRVHAVGTRSG